MLIYGKMKPIITGDGMHTIYELLNEVNPKYFNNEDKCYNKNYDLNHILKKDSKIKKYRKYGLFLFVAIPLPTTGAWTGSGLAVLLNMRIKAAMLAVFLGNCAAAFIMMVLSGAVVSLFA